MRARRVKDYTVLVNLTLVCLHALPLAPAHLVHWAPALWRRLALWTAEQPEVSAWYKLARLLVVQAAVSDIATEHLVSAYFTEVMDRVDGFQEELRLSCFQLLLELPVSCVEGLVGRLAEVLPSILRLGLSLLHLAAAALTVERVRPALAPGVTKRHGRWGGAPGRITWLWGTSEPTAPPLGTGPGRVARSAVIAGGSR